MTTTRARIACDEVADTIQRLAVLLEAGIAPVNAWRYLCEQSGPLASGKTFRGFGGAISRDAVLERVAAEVAAGCSIDQALVLAARSCERRTAQAWRALAAAWLVSSASGSPLAECLRKMSESLRAAAQLQRHVSVSLAAPVATSRLMTVLPCLGVLFGSFLGFDTVGILFTTGAGMACLGLGLLLLFLSYCWNARLVRRCQPTIALVGLRADLLAVALSGGVSLDAATRMVQHAGQSCAVIFESDASDLEGVLDLSRRAGVPAVELLRSEAIQLRRKYRSISQHSVASLSVRLMLPLGVCVLPAFMLLGVAPLLISVISSTAMQW